MNQTYNNFEIIVSIDGSSDDTYNYLLTRKDDFQNLVILNNLNGGRSVCRNRGASIASGDVLIFLDDDMRATNTLIEKHLNFHYQNSEKILVGGQIEEIEKCKTDIQKYKGYLSRKWSKVENEKQTVPYITAANFSIHKKIFYELGLFDERLTDAEDFHLAVLAFEKDIEIYFKPQVLAWHDDFITCKSYIKRLKEYSFAQQKLCELYPDLYSTKYIFRNAPKISKVKKIIYKVFSLSIFVNLIDNDCLKYLPQLLKFKIYDIVIMSNLLKVIK